jgi:hypothetical protein
MLPLGVNFIHGVMLFEKSFFATQGLFMSFVEGSFLVQEAISTKSNVK